MSKVIRTTINFNEKIEFFTVFNISILKEIAFSPAHYFPRIELRDSVLGFLKRIGETAEK